MDHKVIENEDNHQPVWVVQESVDAQAKRYKGRYTKEQIVKAERIYERASSAFIRSRVFLNYRRDFISIKIDEPNRVDLVSPAVQRFEDDVEQQGAAKVKTARGIIYRLAA